ncbi:CPBP family intramembrane glutamic endopeptidase [Staphylococcus intermedius]|uniref:CPBP family intramembrane glutamic endopeptidase n=1 Tax=Staphylococcus intermedius TaxID=1285 RepID=UPI000BBB7F66|nr:type II CAAX endopeptidase family protein [Staphylococcus intermedius]PCF86334.1 CPBP family intramembrane metalloprotease [Staphylococcus intermedius]
MKIILNIFKILGMSLLLFFISVFAQNLGILWHLIHFFTLEYVLHGLTYLVVAFLLVKLLINKVLKQHLEDYRITVIKIFPLCILLGVLLTIGVITFYLIVLPGNIMFTHFDTKEAAFEMGIGMIWITGIVAPIVEEVVFRGVLLKYIEDKTNIVTAIIVTSILFALVHLFNGKLSGIDLYLLIIAGTFAGMMYAVATYQYHSIWASIVIHMCWNLGGLFTITNTELDYGFVQYIIRSNHALITGGEYGVDASIISILGYCLVITVLLFSNNVLKNRSYK